MHLHVLRCRDEYVSTAEPPSVVTAVMAPEIVANDHRLEDFVKNAGKRTPTPF